MGAIFVEEIGVGGTFKHSDLQETECYILDSGTNEIFIWHGIESTYQGRALCTRVCREYIKELKQIHLTENHCLLQVTDDISVAYLESHQEISSFHDCFIYWNHSIDMNCLTSEPVCQAFHPEEIDEDEMKDEKYDKHGHIKQELIKPKYSETHQYKHELNSPHDRELDNKTPKEDFRSFQLKHYEQVSPRQEHNGDDESTNPTPEFLVQRNRLKSIANPDGTNTSKIDSKTD